ncbi:zinc-binding dehydrogenase [Rhodococcus sp. NPDC058521]|uniref:zinc-binding dehydrogenase n=1 Tax=Rhodococcus sp. NPDC058521 TaxID=3346536 RepID=UPI003652DDD2
MQSARRRGADVTVDYTEDGWVQRVRDATGGFGATLIFDGAGGDLGVEAFDATADGGRFTTYGSSGGFTEIGPDAAHERRIDVYYALAAGPPDRATARARLERALSLAEEGRLRPEIGVTYPLERAVDAHVALANRSVIGKSLLLVRTSERNQSMSTERPAVMRRSSE